MIDDLPDDPTQLTAEMLTFLFRDGGLAPSNPGVEVAEVTTEPLAQGSAFLGSLARLNITWADRDTALPNRFVAKVPTQDPGGRTVGKMLNVWVREAQFYARLAPLVATPVPTCRANFISGNKALLLLDDLYPASAGDQLIGASADQAHAAVEGVRAGSEAGRHPNSALQGGAFGLPGSLRHAAGPSGVCTQKE